MKRYPLTGVGRRFERLAGVETALRIAEDLGGGRFAVSRLTECPLASYLDRETLERLRRDLVSDGGNCGMGLYLRINHEKPSRCLWLMERGVSDEEICRRLLTTVKSLRRWRRLFF